MNIDTFESEFPDFFIEFGYQASGHLPASISVSSLLSRNLETESGDIAAVMHEHADTWDYFVVLSWHSFNVGRYPCTQAEYNNGIIPPAAIAAAQNYTPPIPFD